MINRFIKLSSLLLYIIIFSFSCNNCIEGNQLSKISTISVDSISIPIDHNHLNQYISNEILTLNDTAYYIGYNSIGHKYDIFNLVDQRFHSSIILQKEGPNQVVFGSVRKFITLDSVVVYDQMRNVKWLKGNKIIKNQEFDWSDIDNISYSYSSLSYPLNVTDSSVFLFPIYGRYQQQGHPIIIEVSVNGNTYFHKPKYDNPKLNEKWYYDLILPVCTTKGNFLIYNFKVSSDVYKYNLQTGDIDFYETETNHGKNPIDPILEGTNDMALGKYLRRSTLYYGVQYNEYLNMYLRSYRVYNERTKKYNFYLSIMDAQFNLIKEIEIPNSIVLNYKNGFIIPLLYPDTEEYLKFMKYTISN